MSTTTNLGDFGAREREMAADLLKAMNGGLPDDFSSDGVEVMMNTMSGNVFLTNSEYQVAMLNDDGELLSFYSSPYDGKEGFFSDLLDEYPSMHREDKEWFEQLHEDYYSDVVLPMEANDGTWIKTDEEYWMVEDGEVNHYTLDSDTDRDETIYATEIEAWKSINEEEDFGLNYEAFASDEDFIQAVKDRLEE